MGILTCGSLFIPLVDQLLINPTCGSLFIPLVDHFIDQSHLWITFVPLVHHFDPQVGFFWDFDPHVGFQAKSDPQVGITQFCTVLQYSTVPRPGRLIARIRSL